MVRNYGGAFDIDSEMYWTRDDLNELQNAIEEQTDHFVITEMFLEPKSKCTDLLELTYRDKYDIEETCKTPVLIDQKKARTTKELCDAYAVQIKDIIEQEIQEYWKDLEPEEMQR